MGLTTIGANQMLSNRGLKIGQKAQRMIDSEVLRRCDPLIPLDTGTAKTSGNLNTVIGQGQVKYMTPYIRAIYYEPKSFAGQPLRGNYWFERMKQNGGAKAILKLVADEVGGKAE